MRKILCLALTLVMIFSCTVLASEKVIKADTASDLSGAVLSGGKVTLNYADNFALYKGVDLTGIKAVGIKADFTMELVAANGDAIQLRLDDPIKGKCIGYIVLSDKESYDKVFYTNIEATEGVHDLYLKSTYGDTGSEFRVSEIILSDKAVENTYTIVHDSAIVDGWYDTLAATDALGRKIADYAEVGDVKNGTHKVGITYWNWSGGRSLSTAKPTGGSNARIPSEIIAANPDAKDDYNHKAWDTNAVYHWAEPIFGYTSNYDYFKFRRHAEMLAMAGVDSVFLDWTNGSNIFLDTTILMFQAFSDAKAAGVNVPKICAMDSWASDYKEREKQVKAIYLNFIKNEQYKDLWFTWDDKPLLFGGTTREYLSNKSFGSGDTESDRLLNEIFDNCTVRDMGNRSAGEYTDGANSWVWLQKYPQTAWDLEEDGRPECISLGVAINQSYVFENEKTGVFSDPYTRGRSYTEAFGEDYREGAMNEGYFFREQESRVLDLDPSMVMVGGWNEWIAARQSMYSGFENAFVDTFDDENSRDIEPSKGKLRDDYYMLLIDFCRKYKGVRPARVAGEAKAIDIAGDLSQWDSVTPEYLNIGGGYERDIYGMTNHLTGEKYHYVTKEVNRILSSKVSRDDANLYFLVKAQKDIVEADGFMHIYIDIDRNRATGWEGYDFAVNLGGKGTLSSCTDGLNFGKVADVSVAVKGNAMTVSVPRWIVGEAGAVEFEFKIADSAKERENFLNVYEHGSVAPLGRMNYLYTEIPQVTLDAHTRSLLFETSVVKAGSKYINVEGGKMFAFEADTRYGTFAENGTVYVPVKAAEDILGYGETKIEFYSDENLVYVKSHKLENYEIVDNRWTYSFIGTNEVRVNGKVRALSNPLKLVDGIPYMPITYFAEAFDLEVKDLGGGIFAIGRYGINEAAALKAAENL
ncbi:MAG: hypothetical protein IJD97_11960 [Clostridia bacterium]|nr:hypothetical protein [Clostridia bacterium]